MNVHYHKKVLSHLKFIGQNLVQSCQTRDVPQVLRLLATHSVNKWAFSVPKE